MKLRYLVNFEPELVELAYEAKQLEQMGFHIPELTRNLALQLDKYLDARYRLQDMVDRYHKLMDSLDAAEVGLSMRGYAVTSPNYHYHGKTLDNTIETYMLGLYTGH